MKPLLKFLLPDHHPERSDEGYVVSNVSRLVLRKEHPWLAFTKSQLYLFEALDGNLNLDHAF